MNTIAASDRIRWFADEITKDLGEAVSSLVGEDITAARDDGSVAAGPAIWFEVPCDLASGAAVWVGGDAACGTVGMWVLEAAGIPPDGSTERSTFFEAVTQAVSAAVSALGSMLQRSLACSAGTERDTLAAGVDPVARVTVRRGTVTAGPFVIALSKPLIDHLQPPRAVQEPQRPDVAPVPMGNLTAPATGRTLDLLYDVELPVSVSFGRAQLQIKDVMKLTTGSIVELNRAVTEPVEIIVNNCVIARGEVVVVEGNYGVRIDQIITRQERLRTLK